MGTEENPRPTDQEIEDKKQADLQAEREARNERLGQGGTIADRQAREQQ